MPRRIAVFLVFLLLSSGARADIGAAMKAYRAGEFASALKSFQPLAESGDAAAQFWLGLMFDGGKGVERDGKAALGWFRKASSQGHAEAKRVIGIYYEEGNVVARQSVG